MSLNFILLLLINVRTNENLGTLLLPSKYVKCKDKFMDIFQVGKLTWNYGEVFLIPGKYSKVPLWNMKEDKNKNAFQ